MLICVRVEYASVLASNSGCVVCSQMATAVSRHDILGVQYAVKWQLQHLGMTVFFRPVAASKS